MSGNARLRRLWCASAAVVVLAAAGGCGGSASETVPESSSPSAPATTGTGAAGTTAPASAAEGFGDHQEVAGYTITRVPPPQGASLPDGVTDLAAYDITTSAGAPVARYLRITSSGGARADDATLQTLLADVAGAHGGGTPSQTTIAGLPSWEVSCADGTVGIARASEDGPVVVFLGTDRGAVETMIGAVSAALDTPR